MTVVVLNTDEKSVVLAADQLWEDNEIASYATKIVPIMKGTKVIGAIGTAGSARKGIQFEEKLAAYLAKAPTTTQPLINVRTFVDTVWLQKKCPLALVVFRGVGICVDKDGCVTLAERHAIGSGGEIALGAMWERQGSAARIARLGCQAACDITTSCGGKIDVFEMPRQQT